MSFYRKRAHADEASLPLCCRSQTPIFDGDAGGEEEPCRRACWDDRSNSPAHMTDGRRALAGRGRAVHDLTDRHKRESRAARTAGASDDSARRWPWALLSHDPRASRFALRASRRVAAGTVPSSNPDTSARRFFHDDVSLGGWVFLQPSTRFDVDVRPAGEMHISDCLQIGKPADRVVRFAVRCRSVTSAGRRRARVAGN
jgi:hypothetical protein